MKKLRFWVVAIIVMVVVYEVYIACAFALPRIAAHTEAAIYTVRLLYNDLGLLLYAVLATAFLMAGGLVYRADRSNRLAMIGGELLAICGIWKLLWQLLYLIANHTAMTISLPLSLAEDGLGSLLFCASLVVLAWYYKHPALRGLSIAYVVTDLIFMTHHTLSLFVPSVAHSRGAAYFGLFAAATIILELIYLVKWARIKDLRP